MFVTKVTEIIASSSESFDDAVNKGIKSVGETLAHVRSAWVKGLNVVVENGKITECHNCPILDSNISPTGRSSVLTKGTC
jgi:flavin-binding protein dodecin